VLISEVMLQQTTVATVQRRFAPFLANWPTPSAMAAAPLDAVLTDWQGLGYYRRARALHDAARRIAEDHAGRVPDHPAALRRLPGIGDYAAAAIAAIAFGHPVVPIDGNVRRVLIRLDAIDLPGAAAERAVRAAATRLRASERAGDLAQAVMELGALVCTPRRPACAACPWTASCRAHAEGLAERLPRPKARSERPVRHAVAFLLRRDDGAILLRRRPDQGLLGGMIELPSTLWLDHLPGEAEIAAAAPVTACWRAVPGEIRHVFTHLDLRLRLWSACGSVEATGLWTAPTDLTALALPTLTRKLLRHGGVSVPSPTVTASRRAA
jgi:A/G-specific adenine glycosylase